MEAVVEIRIDFISPINEDSKAIEERFYEELVNRAYNSISAPEVYTKQVPNVRSETKDKPTSARMARFKKAGLIGCFNNTRVNSENYKNFLFNSNDEDSEL